MIDRTEQQDRASLTIVALLAFLISIPLFISAGYEWVKPQYVVIEDQFTPTFEQFKIDRWEHMTDRDIFLSGMSDEAKLRQTYEAIAAGHWNLVKEQTRRHLLMYGALFIVSLGHLLFSWRAFRKEDRKRQGIKITPRHRPVVDPGKHRGED
jgi:hypothetical protein